MANTAQFLSRQSQQSIVVDHHGPLVERPLHRATGMFVPEHQALFPTQVVTGSKRLRDAKRMASRNDIVDP